MGKTQAIYQKQKTLGAMPTTGSNPGSSVHGSSTTTEMNEEMKKNVYFIYFIEKERN